MRNYDVNRMKKQIDKQKRLIKKLKGIIKIYAPYMNIPEE